VLRENVVLAPGNVFSVSHGAAGCLAMILAQFDLAVDDIVPP
jgi:hypothetical protein